MKIWSFVLSLVLFGSLNLQAKNISVSHHSTAAYADGFGLLNPPSNLHAVKIGTNWSDIEWNLVPGASQYLIRAFDRVSGVQVYSALVQGTVSGIHVTWPDNSSGQIDVKIWSIGSDGGQSENYSLLPIQGIILELVATGLQGTYCQTTCTLDYSPNSCSSFPWNNSPTIFKVSWSSAGFEIKPNYYSVKGNSNVVTLGVDTEGSLYAYSMEGGHYVIRYNGQVVATLMPELVANASLSGNLYRFINNSGYNNNAYVIYKCGPGFGGDPTGSRNEDPTTGSNIADTPFTAAPNPFTDALTIQLPETTNPLGTTVHLYDLLGSVKRTYTATADQTELNINTADLAPGVYFLQLKTGGKIETLKVLKTQ